MTALNVSVVASSFPSSIVIRLEVDRTEATRAVATALVGSARSSAGASKGKIMRRVVSSTEAGGMPARRAPSISHSPASCLAV